jgi:hypothetical protein
MLLQKLIQRYSVPPSVPQQKKQVVQMRVAVVMKRWVALFSDPEEIELLDKITSWVESESSEGNNIMAGIKGALVKRRRSSCIVAQFYFKDKPPAPRIPKEKSLASLFFEELDALEMARQLTLVEFDIFSRIRVRTLLPSEFPILTQSSPSNCLPRLGAGQRCIIYVPI